MEKKMLKVIEELGEMLINKDNKIKLQGYEIEQLKNKIIQIEKYIATLEKQGA